MRRSIKVDGYFGYTHHVDRSGVSQNFSAPTGDVTVDWSPLRFLNSRMRLSQLFTNNDALFANGVKDTRVEETVTGNVSTRTSLALGYIRDQLKYRFDTALDAALSSREETRQYLSATLQTRIRDWAVASLGYLYERRASPDPSLRYKAHSVTIILSAPLGAARNSEKSEENSRLPQLVRP